ncbi:hypothetical protein yc1106_02909 [Curvularia clavata]|uniref:Uncharacterized protein n=1 Tax=Curvularia clavata TaxID=95742 RepID=A0A9Q8Z5P6_CURCL|nr:hypothetical protein yc1106_02909 [Curvularia clavata]
MMLLTMSTTHSRETDFIRNWHLYKRKSTFFKRLGMHSLEVAAITAAMLMIPLTIHRAVQGFDEMYEILGRRAESPYAQFSWMNASFAFIVLLGWHLWLGRLAYLTVLEGGVDEEKDEGREGKSTLSSSSTDQSGVKTGKEVVSWGRLLGRIVIPLLLVTLGLHFAYQICGQFIGDEKPLITKNDVDMQEAMGQLYGLS